MSEIIDSDIESELNKIETEIKNKLKQVYGISSLAELDEFIEGGSFDEDEYLKVKDTFRIALNNIIKLADYDLHPLNFTMCINKIKDYEKFLEIPLGEKTNPNNQITAEDEMRNETIPIFGLLINYIQKNQLISNINSSEFALADKAGKILILEQTGLFNKDGDSIEQKSALYELENGLRGLLKLISAIADKEFQSVQKKLRIAAKTRNKYDRTCKQFQENRSLEARALNEIDIKISKEPGSIQFRSGQPTIYGMLVEKIYYCLDKIKKLREIREEAINEIAENKEYTLQREKIQRQEIETERQNNLELTAIKHIKDLIIQALNKKWKKITSKDITQAEAYRLVELGQRYKSKIDSRDLSPKDVEAVIAECIERIFPFGEEKAEIFKTSEYDDWLRDEHMFGPRCDLGIYLPQDNFLFTIDITTTSTQDDAQKKITKIISSNPTTLKNIPEHLNLSPEKKNMAISLILSVKISDIEKIINRSAIRTVEKLKGNNIPVQTIIELKELNDNQIYFPDVDFTDIIDNMIEQIKLISYDFFINSKTREEYQKIFNERKRYTTHSFQEQLECLRKILIRSLNSAQSQSNVYEPSIVLKPSTHFDFSD